MRIFVLLILAVWILPLRATHAVSCAVFTGIVQHRLDDPAAISGSKLTAVWNFSNNPVIDQNDYSALGLHTLDIVAETASLHFTGRPHSQKNLFIRTKKWISCYVEDSLRVSEWGGGHIKNPDSFACFSGHPKEEEPYEAWFRLLYPNNHFDQQIAFAEKPIINLGEIGDISPFNSSPRRQITIQNVEYKVTILTAEIKEGCADNGLQGFLGAVLPLLLEGK